MLIDTLTSGSFSPFKDVSKKRRFLSLKKNGILACVAYAKQANTGPKALSWDLLALERSPIAANSIAIASI